MGYGRVYHQSIRSSNAELMRRIEVFLSADPAEYERRLGFYHLTVHLKQRGCEKIDWAARHLGINYQIAVFCQLETIGRAVAEVVIGQLWIFPRFADIHRDPASTGERFSSAMVAVDRAFILVGWNGGANRKTGRFGTKTFVPTPASLQNSLPKPFLGEN
jgi:hypothetical protein